MSSHVLERFARGVTKIAGTSAAFATALLVIFLWIASGPLFHFSDTWQLVINTGTTIVTFLMVFLIQRTQNKDSLALHLKLNELIAAMKGASNRLVNVEDLTEDQLELLHRHYAQLAELARSVEESHGEEGTARRHEQKKAHAIDQGGNGGLR